MMLYASWDTWKKELCGGSKQALCECCQLVMRETPARTKMSVWYQVHREALLKVAVYYSQSIASWRSGAFQISVFTRYTLAAIVLIDVSSSAFSSEVTVSEPGEPGIILQNPHILWYLACIGKLQLCCSPCMSHICSSHWITTFQKSWLHSTRSLLLPMLEKLFPAWMSITRDLLDPDNLESMLTSITFIVQGKCLYLHFEQESLKPHANHPWG